MDLDTIKKEAKRFVRKAGERLYREYDGFNRGTVKLKTSTEIVTKADLISEEIIIKAIKREFPAHQILSEESGKTKRRSDYLWVVDPLDGTTNFSIHNPLWSVSVGLAYKKEIVLGLVYAPVQDELFVAAKGGGAELNGQGIKVSKTGQTKTIHAFCHGHRTRDIKIALKYYRRQKLGGLDCRQLGSAAIELCYVAAGRIESIMIPGAHAWDVAAGALMVSEAGGRVTDFQGRRWSLGSEDIVASNGKAHRGVLAVINK